MRLRRGAGATKKKGRRRRAEEYGSFSTVPRGTSLTNKYDIKGDFVRLNYPTELYMCREFAEAFRFSDVTCYPNFVIVPGA